jgi:hypothetical protein
MNETPDPLEMELAALRPRDVSPELRGRIARRLAEVSTPERRGPRWFALSAALSAALAAACVVAAVFWRVGHRGDEPKPDIAGSHPVPRPEASSSIPTLLVYERALARSPEELESRMSAFRWPLRDASSFGGRAPAAAAVID